MEKDRPKEIKIGMKLGTVIREADFISSRIFINVYKPQCLQCFAVFEE